MKNLNDYLMESLDREQSFEANWLVENPTKRIDKKSDRKYLDGLANAIQYLVFPKELKNDIKQLESGTKNNEPIFRTAIDMLVNSNWYIQLRQFSVDKINGHNHLVWDDDLGNKMYFDPKANLWCEF